MQPVLIQALIRRSATIPLYVGLTLLVTIAAPVLLILCALISIHPAYRGAVHALGFIVGYLWCETIGIFCAFYIWLRHRNPESFLSSNYRLQSWWSESLARITQRLFSLHFEVDNRDALKGPAAFIFPRHSSIADTLIPMVFYAIPEDIHLRYVLKKELLIDPCLDIVGHRLPNFFIDRNGPDSDAARAGIAILASDLSVEDGILLYPEGTRFSQLKRARLSRRYADNPDLLKQLARWPSLMPPRLGGFLSLLEANPGRDLIFCGHTGFEGSSHVATLLNGSWRHAHIRITFWRIPYQDIPATPDSRIAFLFDQWDRMQDWVERNSLTNSQFRTSGGPD